MKTSKKRRFEHGKVSRQAPLSAAVKPTRIRVLEGETFGGPMTVTKVWVDETAITAEALSSEVGDIIFMKHPIEFSSPPLVAK